MNAEITSNTSSLVYNGAVVAIKTAILQGQYEAAKGVNRIQLAVYFAIGRFVSQNSRQGKWGTGALAAISKQLQREMPGLRGYSAESMKLMRRFYEAWEILDANALTEESNDYNSVIAITESTNSNSLIAINESTDKSDVSVNTESPSVDTVLVNGQSQNAGSEIDIYNALTIPNLVDFPAEDFFKVPFTHHIRIVMAAKDYSERCYYIHRQAEEHLSVEALAALIKQGAYHNQNVPPNNFKRTLNNEALARKAVMAFKDEYLLNFINVEQIGERDAMCVDERVVEQQIVHNIKNFMMAMGRDFAFIGNQYHLEAYSEEFFPDLLFFNRELNAMVVIELKTGVFKPTYLAQLTTYLRILDDKVRKPHENPSIGIVLCKSVNKKFVEYIIQDYEKPMGVATYTCSEDMPEKLRRALPPIEDLRKLLDTPAFDCTESGAIRNADGN